MGSGAICPVCDRHYSPPECRHCSYVEGTPGARRLTRVVPRRRVNPDREITEPVREALARMAPDQLSAHRRGIADARAALANAVARKGAA